MERLTYDFCMMNTHCWQIKGADNLECREVCENQDDLEGCKTCPIAKAFNRLAEIENILGDEYDLDRLRELVEADRDERQRNKELTAQLRRMSVETGSLVCLGCGYEHNCGIHGCALLRQAVETIERQDAAIERLRGHECSGLAEKLR